jgi:hypothetical protein
MKHDCCPGLTPSHLLLQGTEHAHPHDGRHHLPAAAGQPGCQFRRNWQATQDREQRNTASAGSCHQQHMLTPATQSVW